MQTAFDAVIVGAGPAGATAAILLAQAGWSVALIEKQAFPRRKVCGECIAASNLPLLDALGIGAQFAARAGPELRHVALLRGKHSVVAALPPALDPDHSWGRALGRETLDMLLVARAKALGATVFQPWSVQRLQGRAGDHRCDIRASAAAVAGATAATLHAPVAIAAHGSWERLPSARQSRRLARRPSDLFAFKANFRGAALPTGLLPVLSFAGGYGGIVVADAGVTTLACCIREDRLDACRRAAPGLRAGDAVEALLRRECRGVDEALRGAVRDGAWLASGPLDPGVRIGRDGDDAVFRIGNAAGEAHPIIGEGISMALQSAWLLCARLIAERPPHRRRSAMDGAAADKADDIVREIDRGAERANRARGADRADRGDRGDRGADRDADRNADRDADRNADRETDPAAWQRAVHARYADDWRRHFGPRLRLAAAFAHVAMQPQAAAALMALLGRWPGLLSAGTRWSGKLRAAVDPVTIDRLATPRPAGGDGTSLGAQTARR